MRTGNVLNALCRETQPTAPVILGKLIFRPKPGNSRSDVNNYRPISVLDTDRRIFHSVLAKRIAPQLAKMIPPAQTGFIPGRAMSSNILVLALLAEAAAHGWFDQPIVVLEQDQAKAYDHIRHRWRDRVPDAANTPKEIKQLLRNLYDGATIRFQLDEGISEPVSVRRGLLQGAADSPLWYTLLYQPFLDAFERSKAGVTIPFETGSIHFSYIAYADNSYFFLKSEEDAKAYWAARRKYDLALGSRLNERESSVTVLWPKGVDKMGVPWIDEFSKQFKTREPGESFKCLGRLLRLTAEPASDLVTRTISSRLCNSWGQANQYLSLFGKAALINSQILSRIWFILEAIPLPKPSVEIFKQIRRRLLPLLQTQGRARISWKVAIRPKEEGGLGILDPAAMIPAAFANIIFRLLADGEKDGPGMLLVIGFTRWLKETYAMSPAAITFLSSYGNVTSAGRETTRKRTHYVKWITAAGGIPLDDPGEGILARVLDACLRIPITIAPTVDWSLLSPAEAAALPWFNDSYPLLPIWRVNCYYRSVYSVNRSRLPAGRTDEVGKERFAKWRKTVINWGLSTFADVLWLHAESEEGSFITSSGFQDRCGVPASLLAVRRHAARYPMADRAPCKGDEKIWITFPRVFPSYIDALPNALASKLGEYAQQEAARLGPVTHSIPLRETNHCFPWRLMSYAEKEPAELSTRFLRGVVAKAGEPIIPSWVGLPQPSNATRGNAILERDSDSDGSEFEETPALDLATSSSTQGSPYAKLVWKNIWPKIHAILILGVGQETWALVLHGKGPTITQVVHNQLLQRWEPRSALCPFCRLKHTSQHAYLECEGAIQVWKASWLVLQQLITSVPEWQEVDGVTILEGFPQTELRLGSNLATRFRSWFSLVLCAALWPAQSLHLPSAACQCGSGQ